MQNYESTMGVILVSTKRARANGEGTIRKRSDGRWEGLYSYNGKRKSVYGKTQGETKTKLNKVLHDIGAGSYTENQSLTFGQWLDSWLQTYAKPPLVRTSTYASYETYIRGHIKPALGKVKLQSLRPDHLQNFLNEKQAGGRLDNTKGGLSAKTIKNIYNVIHRALQQAYMSGMVSRNVADVVIRPKQTPAKVTVLTVQERKNLVEKCREHRLGVGIILTLYSGVRLGELLGLMWTDIDIENRTMTISRTLNRLTVHDNPDHKTAIVIGEPKSVSGHREIPLNEAVIPFLIKLKEQQQEERLLFGQDYLDEGYVICNERGKHIEPRTYQDFFKKMLREANVPNKNFHALRHTFATWALEIGMDINVVAAFLGHADPSITLRVYAHALPDHKRESMDRLPAMWEEDI